MANTRQQEKPTNVVEGKNVFLSGPMTGCEYNNVAEFAKAHAIVRALGARYVYNPAHTWLMQPLERDAKRSHESYMCECVNELTLTVYAEEPGHVRPFYGLLVSLKGWYMSEGATHENDVAEQCGIHCVDIEYLEGVLERLHPKDDGYAHGSE